MTSPIDKPTLREQLDAIRPDSDDVREVDLQEAAAALETSDEWRAIFARQQSFDREVAAVMQEVDVPEGLQGRLLSALESGSASSSSVPTPDRAPASSEERVSRRLFPSWPKLTAAALLLAVGLSALLWPRGEATFALNEIRGAIPVVENALPDAAAHSDADQDLGTLNLAGLEQFDGSFEVEPLLVGLGEWPPAEWLGLDVDEDGIHDAVVVEFGDRRTHGCIVIVPYDRVADPPEDRSFNSANVSYQPLRNVAWTQPAGKSVYICVIDRGDIDTLRRLLTPRTA